MKIEKLIFEKEEIKIKETYIDTDGKTKERTKKVLVPTGKCQREKSNEEQVSKTIRHNKK